MEMKTYYYQVEKPFAELRDIYGNLLEEGDEVIVNTGQGIGFGVVESVNQDWADRDKGGYPEREKRNWVYKLTCKVRLTMDCNRLGAGHVVTVKSPNALVWFYETSNAPHIP